jgi:putative hydrolase of HD superfamily
MTADATVIASDDIDLASSRALLNNEAFRAFWLARLAAQTAQGALLYGLLVLIVDRTDRSIFGALFVLCSIVPSLLFGLFGGWVADLLPQRMLLIALNALRAAMVVLLLSPDTGLSTIFLVTLGIWTAHQFFSPAESSVLARIVGVERLSEGQSLHNFALTIAQVLGMVILAPVLLKLPDERFLFAACGALYALAGVLCLRMGRLGREKTRTVRPPLALKRGWEVVSADRPSYTAMIDEILLGIGLSALVVIVPYYLVGVLDTSAGNTVFVFAPAVLGLVLGLRIAPKLGRAVGYGRLATFGLVGFALCIAMLGLIDRTVSILTDLEVPLNTLEDRIGIAVRTSATMLVSIPAGFCSSLTNVAARTVLLERSPEDSRGQVLATGSVIANAGALIPTLLAGVAVDVMGVRPVALSISALMIGVAVGARRWSGENGGVQGNLWSSAAQAGLTPAEVGMLRFAEGTTQLKRVRRQGWVDRGVRQPESVADHSWSVAMLAWVLAGDRPELDRERVLLIGLIHDLPEAEAGDTTPFDQARSTRGKVPRNRFRDMPVYSAEAKQRKREREMAALDKLLLDLPPELADDIRDAWEEYEQSETAEARFVRQVDKLETLLQAEDYRKRQPHLVIDSFRLGARRDITDDELSRLLDAIGPGQAVPGGAAAAGEQQATAPLPARRQSRARRRPRDQADRKARNE